MAANDIKRGMLLEQDGGKKLLEVQELSLIHISEPTRPY